MYNAAGTTINGGAHTTFFTGALIAPVNATAGGWQNDGTQSFLADSTDKVGIGTSTPWAKLSINSTAGIPQFVIGSSTTQFIVDQNGNVGIGTTGTRGLLDVQSTSQASGLTTGYFYSDANVSGISTTSIQIEKGTGYGGRISGYLSQGVGSGLRLTTLNGGTPLDVMTLDNAGNVGIGSTDPGAGLGITSGFSFLPTAAGPYLTIGHASGVSSGQPWLGFSYNGTAIGSVTQNSTTGTLFNTSSDRRLKEQISTTTLGLDALMRLSVRDFSFTSDPTRATTSGFIAQELQQVFPWAVTTNGDNGIDALGTGTTPWSVDYGRITPLLAKSIQDLNLKLEDLATTTPEADEGTFTSRFFASLFTRLTQWFADATNGIQNLYARVFMGEQLCLGETCITETELKAMLAGATAGATADDGQLLEAPAATSAQQIPHRADTATTTTPTDISTTVVEGISPVRDATSSPETPAANDNQPVADEENEPQAQDAARDPAPVLEASNDNPPPPSAEAI